MNLLANAIKYTPPRGQIRLSVRREGEEVVLRVRDNGVGIPPFDAREGVRAFRATGRCRR